MRTSDDIPARWGPRPSRPRLGGRRLSRWAVIAAALSGGPAAAEPAAAAIEFSAAYTRDLWWNASGGRKKGWASPDNIDLAMSIDAERLLGWRGTDIYVSGLYNNGARFSDTKVGDIQTVSNIETGVRALRLYEAWIEHTSDDGRASIKAGLYDLNAEFDATETSGLFLNASHGIGPEVAQSGANGPSIFPVTSLAVRGTWRLGERSVLRAAVLDAVPGDVAHPRRTAVKLSAREGALIVAEAEHATPRLTLSFGGWRYTGSTPDAVATARTGEPAEARGNWGVYAALDGDLTGDGRERGLSGWVRGGVAEERLNALRGYVGAGLVYTGPFAGRDEDQAGIAVAVALFGGPYRQAQQLAGLETGAAEISIEATYRARLTPHLTLQPDLQYIVHPSGGPGDALVAGLRVEVSY